MRDLTILSPKWKVVIKALSSGPRDLLERGGGKTVRASETGRHQGNSALQTQQNGHPYDHIETVVACTGSAQALDRWGPSAERGTGHKPPFLVQKLSLIDNSLQRKKQLSEYMNHTETQPKSNSRWPTQNKHSGVWGDVSSHNGLFGQF